MVVNMNIWDQKELELSQRHAEILKIRETILRGTERYYDAQNGRSSSFITDYKKAKERNMQLLNDISRVSQVLKSVSDEDAQSHKQFSTLQANYWGMVRNSFPVWLEEQRAYEQKHGLPLSSRSTQHDPNLPRPSPRTRSSPPGSMRINDSPRPGSRASNNGGDTTRTIPPLELDFSMGEDLTISQAVSQSATLQQTPKSALSTSGKVKNPNKKVQIKEDKKSKDEDKKERERQRKEAEKRRKEHERERKLQEKEEKDRKKAEEKERKKSARTPRSDRSK